MLKKNLFFIFLTLFFLQCKITYSVENKITHKINNEILTLIDIKNEEKYLSALNPNLNNLEKEKIFEIAKNSLIREVIKKNEILNYTKEILIDDTQFDNIISSYLLKLNINSKDEFRYYLQNHNLSLNEFREKIAIELIWNQLIYSKFNSKVRINKEALNSIAQQNIENQSNIYLLKEIVFELDNDEKLEKKYNLIKDAVKLNGFENTVMQFSLSPSSKNKGEIGWIRFNSLNSLVKESIKDLSIGELSDPISIPGGFLILKIEDIKKEINNNDLENELDNLIKLRRNEQLNQYSIIYFNKIKKDLKIEEL